MLPVDTVLPLRLGDTPRKAPFRMTLVLVMPMSRAQLGVRAQEGVLPVHWQEVLRLHQLHHLFQLFSVGTHTSILSQEFPP